MRDALSKTVLPGSTIGMVGGGQLGRMFAMAAAAMGYRVVVLCEDNTSPAAQVAHMTVEGELDDMQAVERFASQCDVITLEFENIPAETIARCGHFAPTYPSSDVLATAQNRLIEKTTLKEAGLPVTPMAAVNDTQSLCDAGKTLGWPMIVKTAISGYDGKGQSKVHSPEEAESIDWSACEAWIAEQCIEFDLEVSVIVARSPNGQQEAFPVFENAHHHHILDVTLAPARIAEELAQEAIQIAKAATETLDVVGLLCVEFFVSGETVMINEVAPRPHNSGHLSIEACETSQFEQHVRAVCNLPLGSTSLRSPCAAMANLLGDLWSTDGSEPDWEKALRDPSISLHLYGKETPKLGRKMGHLTMTGNSAESVIQRVTEARRHLPA
ncbi:5-(carboxyamino)imidazole ribonucleotide synthase [bacterium]|nr:5-(carboxyamino)imidazole ribonucleotide synthase [bacterium]